MNTTARNCTATSAGYTLCFKCYVPASAPSPFEGHTYGCGNAVIMSYAELLGATDCVTCATDLCNDAAAPVAPLLLLLAVFGVLVAQTK
jgi:hypothetical protein